MSCWTAVSGGKLTRDSATDPLGTEVFHGQGDVSVRGILNLRHLNEPFQQATLASLVQATKAMTTLLKGSIDFVQNDRTLNCRRQHVFVTGESDDVSYVYLVLCAGELRSAIN